jgi:hypothetical protein
VIGRLHFWELFMTAGPLAAVVLIPLGVSVLGGFDDFQWVDKQATPLQAFGILGTMCLPVAAYFYGRMRWEILKAEQSRTWPVVAGTLERREVKKRYAYRSGTRYLFEVEYTYTAAGQKFDGTLLGFGPRLLIAGDLLDRLTNELQPQKPVQVHYNPDDTSEAVLYTGDELARQRWSGLYILLGTPILLTIICYFLSD